MHLVLNGQMNPFNADYHFCTFADGNGFDELRPIMAILMPGLMVEKDSMWYVWHDPFLIPQAEGSVDSGYDYMIGFYWQNNDEREAGYAAYAD